MEFFLLLFMIFSMPTVVTLFFIVSLITFISNKAKNKKIPNSVDANKMFATKICLIISSVMVGIFIAIFVTVIILFSTVISFM